MKKLSVLLTAVLLIAGVMTANVTSYAAEAKTAAVSFGATAEIHKEQELIEAKELARKLDGQSVEISAKIGADGNFFGSVTSKDIADAIELKFGIHIDKRAIQSPEIRRCGNFNFRISLYTGVVCNMTAVVEYR